MPGSILALPAAMVDPPPRPAPSELDDEHRTSPPPDQDGHADSAGDATPGDLDAPDIVSPTGEEMPVQHHDEVDSVR